MIAFSLLLTPAIAPAEDYIEQNANGSINWTKGEIHARGIGVPPKRYLKFPARARAMAVRAAKVDALRNLLEQMQGVRVEAQTLMKDAAVESDAVHTSMQGVVHNASMVGAPHYYEDGSVEVEMAVNYRGSVAPPVAQMVSKRLEREAGARPRPLSPPPSGDGAEQNAITGLIIDARGLGLRPALAPKIVDTRGRVLYSALVVDPQQGGDLAAYDRSLEHARAMPRAGARPMVVKGVKVQDIGDVVISSDDADRLDRTPGLSRVLRQARVVIVL
ncbi:MAG: hypothetical protein D6682_02415 [Zetaproteobacteria bacterium]|nr:MAG: hypothetical protein D6682_02415 [Zetaproteobacteria bacterium]